MIWPAHNVWPRLAAAAGPGVPIAPLIATSNDRIPIVNARAARVIRARMLISAIRVVSLRVGTHTESS
jgi:hypothetical protein